MRSGRWSCFSLLQPDRPRRPGRWQGRARTLALVALVALAVGGCQRRRTTVPEDPASLLEAAMPSMMEEGELRARELLLDMAQVLTAQLEQPTEAVRRMQALLRVNRTELVQVALLLQSRWDSLSGVQARVYEAQLSQWMAPATAAWSQAERAFSQRWPEEGRQVQALLQEVDGFVARARLEAEAEAEAATADAGAPLDAPAAPAPGEAPQPDGPEPAHPSEASP